MLFDLLLLYTDFLELEFFFPDSDLLLEDDAFLEALLVDDVFWLEAFKTLAKLSYGFTLGCLKFFVPSLPAPEPAMHVPVIKAVQQTAQKNPTNRNLGITLPLQTVISCLMLHN